MDYPCFIRGILQTSIMRVVSFFSGSQAPPGNPMLHRLCLARGGGASGAVRSQAEPGTEDKGRKIMHTCLLGKKELSFLRKCRNNPSKTQPLQIFML